MEAAVHCPGCDGVVRKQIGGPNHEGVRAVVRSECPGCLLSGDEFDAVIDMLKSDLLAVLSALDRCDSNRGRFSCAPAHDCRCEKDRKISDTCTCGADELADALSRPGIRKLVKTL